MSLFCTIILRRAQITHAQVPTRATPLPGSRSFALVGDTQDRQVTVVLRKKKKTDILRQRACAVLISETGAV
jgi:hypothetical protein